MAFNPADYTVPTAKPLPVIFLLDVSGSMYGSKILALNQAVEDMLQSFSAENAMENEIRVSVITFGNQVKLHLPFTKADEIKWIALQADGGTPMGTALRMAKDMIEDKDVIPSRAYRPTIVLVTDGAPTDEWEPAMDEFLNQGRSSKCFCLAMGIGESDDSVLKRFISKTPDLAQRGGTTIPNRVFHADDASHMYEFFKKVAMSVTQRSKSTTPNAIPSMAEDADDEESYW